VAKTVWVKVEGIGEFGQTVCTDNHPFEKEASFCIQCGLWVRYCAEVKNKHAVGFVDRGTKREIGKG
jgi:bidirectional [NiFe] hydrogenase diaphorase subunit